MVSGLELATFVIVIIWCMFLYIGTYDSGPYEISTQNNSLKPLYKNETGRGPNIVV